jgi:hypothetical protein
MERKLFRDLVLSCVGRAGFVYGGGKSGHDRIEELRSRYPNAVRVSANLHGLKIEPCDYVVCVDDDIELEHNTHCPTTPLITYHRWAHYRLIEYPSLTNSGQYAIWAALHMGCSPIFVFGMDCYTNGTYFHDPEAYSTGNRLTLEQHLVAWRQLAKVLPRHNNGVRFVGGPVPPIFPAYRPDEVIPPVEFPERYEVLRQHHGKRVRITRDTPIGPERFLRDQYVELSERDARRLITERRAVSAPVSL